MHRRHILALAASLATGGCMQYLVQTPAPSLAGSPHEVRANSYLGSELQQPPYVLAKKCVGDEQLGRVLVKRNFGQGFLSWITFGLYAPATVVYECANVNEPTLGNSSDGAP